MKLPIELGQSKEVSGSITESLLSPVSNGDKGQLGTKDWDPGTVMKRFLDLQEELGQYANAQFLKAKNELAHQEVLATLVISEQLGLEATWDSEHKAEEFSALISYQKGSWYGGLWKLCICNELLKREYISGSCAKLWWVIVNAQQMHSACEHILEQYKKGRSAVSVSVPAHSEGGSVEFGLVKAQLMNQGVFVVLDSCPKDTVVEQTAWIDLMREALHGQLMCVCNALHARAVSPDYPKDPHPMGPDLYAPALQFVWNQCAELSSALWWEPTERAMATLLPTYFEESIWYVHMCGFVRTQKQKVHITMGHVNDTLASGGKVVYVVKPSGSSGHRMSILAYWAHMLIPEDFAYILESAKYCESFWMWLIENIEKEKGEADSNWNWPHLAHLQPAFYPASPCRDYFETNRLYAKRVIEEEILRQVVKNTSGQSSLNIISEPCRI